LIAAPPTHGFALWNGRACCCLVEVRRIRLAAMACTLMDRLAARGIHLSRAQPTLPRPVQPVRALGVRAVAGQGERRADCEGIASTGCSLDKPDSSSSRAGATGASISEPALATAAPVTAPVTGTHHTAEAGLSAVSQDLGISVRPAQDPGAVSEGPEVAAEQPTAKRPRKRKAVERPVAGDLSQSLQPQSESTPSSREATARPPATPQQGLPETERSPRGRRSGSPESLRFNGCPEVCSICCEDVLPSGATRLRCDHGWYCLTCIARHVEARLDVGAVNVQCPECALSIAERDLRKLVSTEVLNRLLSRSLEQAVAATADLWPCPTPGCPMRVALEANEPARFTCPECKKESCLRCAVQPFHKRLTCERYSQRLKKDRRGSLHRWMEETGAKQCPGCRMAVTKQNLSCQATQRAECHKMLCRSCGTRFCFKCLAVLTTKFTCGCTKDDHGFIDPHSGRRVGHLRKRKAPAGKKKK